jgi:hypothetical protein
MAPTKSSTKLVPGRAKASKRISETKRVIYSEEEHITSKKVKTSQLSNDVSGLLDDGDASLKDQVEALKSSVQMLAKVMAQTTRSVTTLNDLMKNEQKILMILFSHQ